MPLRITRGKVIHPDNNPLASPETGLNVCNRIAEGNTGRLLVLSVILLPQLTWLQHGVVL